MLEEYQNNLTSTEHTLADHTQLPNVKAESRYYMKL